MNASTETIEQNGHASTIPTPACPDCGQRDNWFLFGSIETRWCIPPSEVRLYAESEWQDGITFERLECGHCGHTEPYPSKLFEGMDISIY